MFLWYLGYAYLFSFTEINVYIFHMLVYAFSFEPFEHKKTSWISKRLKINLWLFDFILL